MLSAAEKPEESRQSRKELGQFIHYFSSFDNHAEGFNPRTLLTDSKIVGKRRTLFHAACDEGRLDMVKKVLGAPETPESAGNGFYLRPEEKEKIVTAVSKKKFTPLQLAARSGVSGDNTLRIYERPTPDMAEKYQAIASLIADFAQGRESAGRRGFVRKVLNAQDGKGYTALHDAVYRGNADIAELLLRKGVDPYIKAHDPQREEVTAMDFAQSTRSLLEKMPDDTFIESREDDFGRIIGLLEEKMHAQGNLPGFTARTHQVGGKLRTH